MFRLMSVLLLTCAVNVYASPLFSGYAEKDITPTAEEGVKSCLGGYGQPFSRCNITESADKITTSALSLTKEKDTVILVSIDTVGLGDSILAEIINQAVTLSGNKIKPESILISATHTHSGPDLQGLWGGVSAEYKARAIQSVAQTIVSAYQSKKPSYIYTWTAKSTVENRRGWNIVDDSISVIDVRAFGNSKRIATLVNMSAHPTIIDADNRKWSSDYVGALRTTLNQSLNTKTIFINGIVGDSQPSTDNVRGIERAVKFGTDTGKTIAMKSWSGRMLDSTDIDYTQQTFQQKIENPLFLYALKVGILDLFVDTNNTITTQMGVLSIGCDFKAIVFPGEALTRLGLPMKEALDSKYKMFFGLTTDTLGYFIPHDEFGVIQNRKTEEQASISPMIGDNASQVFLDVNDKGNENCKCDRKNGSHH